MVFSCAILLTSSSTVIPMKTYLKEDPAKWQIPNFLVRKMWLRTSDRRQWDYFASQTNKRGDGNTFVTSLSDISLSFLTSTVIQTSIIIMRNMKRVSSGFDNWHGLLYHFNYSNRTVQSVISFTKITYCTAKIFRFFKKNNCCSDSSLHVFYNSE